MGKILLLCLFSLYIFAKEVENISDIEDKNFNVKTTEITQIFKDIAKDLVEIKKKQFNFLKRLDDVQEKSYQNEQKLKLVELIIDEQKSIIKDLIIELNSIDGKKNINYNRQKESINESSLDSKKEQNEVKNEPTYQPSNESSGKIVRFQPSTFELTIDSEILDSPNKNVIEHWKAGRKFTAYERMDNFIKISGHFAKGKWQRINLNLWIDSNKYPLKEMKK